MYLFDKKRIFSVKILFQREIQTETNAFIRLIQEKKFTLFDCLPFLQFPFQFLIKLHEFKISFLNSD